MNAIAKVTAGSVVAGMLLGCASSPPPAAWTRGPYVKPGLIMLTADQAERRGINLSTPEASAVRMPANVQALDTAAVTIPTGVKVYTLNRAADPADPDVMHEEHVVYRRESAPRWRLDAPSDQKILVGPRVTDGRQEIQPLLTKELTAYLSDQRRATELNGKAISTLFEAVDALNRQQQTLARRELAKTADTRREANDPDSADTAPSPGSR